MSPIFVEGEGGTLIAAPPVTLPPPSAPAPPPAPPSQPPEPQLIPTPGNPLVDGTTLAPPVVAPASPPPAPRPAAPSPAPAPAAPAPSVPPASPLPQPGVPLIDVGEGPLIVAPRVTGTAPPPPPPTVAPPSSPLAPPAGDGTPAPRPIPQPGKPLIDVGDNTLIAAPPRSDFALPPGIGAPPPPPGLEDVGDRSSPLEPEDGPNLGERELFTRNPVLRGAAFVEYVRTRAAHYDLDPLAVFANYLAEGSSGTIGDDGHAYGPWQIWATDGRIRSFAKLGTFSDAVNTWTWSRDGVDYALRSMVAGGAAGLRGHAAVHAIVYGFERPANMRAADLNRQDIYDALERQGERVWAELANAAPGPVHTEPGLATPSGSGPAGGPSVAHEPSAGDVHTAWADLMRVYGRTLPAATVNIRDARRELARSVT